MWEQRLSIWSQAQPWKLRWLLLSTMLKKRFLSEWPLPTPMEVYNEKAIGFLKSTMKQKLSKAIDMIFYWVRDRVNQNQFMIYWRPGANNVGEYVSKHHSPAHRQSMRQNFFVNLIRKNPPCTYTEKCLQRLSSCLQRGEDNPAMNSSFNRISMTNLIRYQAMWYPDLSWVTLDIIIASIKVSNGDDLLPFSWG